ncbi:Copper transport protein family [Rhynchospora pubera]|uniref:Copper transport protein family n=1 Tax=Rhynchospora pubera TaxID=906938 RepID=A0AAV8HIR4_9POAL|nr:Copper transport protein family [Rhynchospora pubera]
MVKQKVVVKLASLDDSKKRTKALKTAVSMEGIVSVSIDRDRLVVVGDGTDVVSLTNMLRKKLGYAELISVTSGEDKIKEEKEGKISSGSKSSSTPSSYQYGYPSVYSYPYPYAYQDSGYGSISSSIM